MLRQLLAIAVGIAGAALWAGVAAAEPSPEPGREFWDPIVETPPGQPLARVGVAVDDVRHHGRRDPPQRCDVADPKSYAGSPASTCA